MPAIGITLIVVAALALVFGVLFFGMAGLFSILGVEYQSNGSLLIFVVCFFLLDAFFDFFANPLIKLAPQHILMRMLIDVTFTWLAIHTVDEFMASIDIPLKIEIIVAILFFLIELAFDEKKKGKEAS